MPVRFPGKMQKRARRVSEQDGMHPAQLLARDELLYPRQEAVRCPTALGQGTCQDAGTCRGFFNTDLNVCPPGSNGPRECCLLSSCKVPQGEGFCQSNISKRCEKDGQYFEGEPPNYPCRGGNDVQCCVENKNIVTGNSTTSTSSSSTTGTSSLLPTATDPAASTTATNNPPTTTSEASPGLSAGAKGGIAGGVITGALIIGLIAALFILLKRQRKAKEAAAASTQADDDTPAFPTAAERRQQENVMMEKGEDDKKPDLLGGSPLSELATDSGVRELESPRTDGKIYSDQKAQAAAAARRPPVELPADAEAEVERGRSR
ncbi:hypothetical protein AJ79_03086 [Helicocarpus griseus UAMH5409]|uniref:Mid2 domain-containing protein n=1 Tax=Helicocarpus griseus UAMH5409 TaxID=1447875 RepID=A0A2B7Y089_9EURO|nr:hypothetical protein AJ79_03086 [Helicocarpus griseus UAMH5409]